MSPKIGSINSIYIDKEKNDICLGSIRHGIIFLRESQIYNYTSDNVSNRVINNDIIQCLKDDYNGHLWFGTDGGGLNYLEFKTGKINHIKSSEGLKVTAIENIDKDHLLISIYNKGIYKVNKNNGKKQQILIVNKKVNDIVMSYDIIPELKKYKKDLIYIITNDIYIYDTKKNTIDKAPNTDITSSNGFFVISQDKDETIIQNYSKIYSINNHTYHTTLLYQSSMGDIISARKYKHKLIINKNHNLVVLDLNTKLSNNIDFPYNNHILSLEIDQKENLWCVTYDNLLCIDPKNMKNYTVFDSADGLVSNEYFPNLSTITESGDIYWGGNTGMCMIDREIITEPTSPNNISLLSVKVDGKNKRYEQISENKLSITIPWDYQSLIFNITLTDGNIFRQYKYKYTIKDSGKETLIESNNSLSLPVLAPGKYLINVANLKHNGQWSAPTEFISIVVTPPWWKSSIIKAIVNLLLLSLIIIIIYYYYNYKKRQVKNVFIENEKKLSDNKVKFLINISHELRTPLTLIYAPLKRILEDVDIDKNIKFQLTRIFTQSKYMIHLINMVLDVRVMEKGYGELNIKTHSFNTWVENIVEEFRLEYENKQIDLVYDLDTRIESLNFDNDKCQIVLSNLLMNAYKYSESNTLVTIKSELFDNSIKLSIIDQGIGLKGVDTERLFDRFVRANDKSEGFGIGLSYTKFLIELHAGAKLGVYSNLHSGSTFYFEIPTNLECNITKWREGEIHENTLDPECKPITLYDSEAYDTSNHNILIVEDEPEMIIFIKEILNSYFKNVYTAQNGVAALELINDKNIDIDLILSDVVMPQMNGYELCHQVKNSIKKSHIPIILLTTQADFNSQITSYKSGADLFFSKPFDSQSLIAVIRNLLENRSKIKAKYKNDPSDSAVKISTFSSPDEQFMTKLNQFITDNIANENLNVELITEHMCMSRATFYKKLKAITESGAMEYVVKRRLLLASLQLKNTTLPIASIAQNIGYPDSQCFSRVFKQHLKQTPSQYRKSFI